MNMIDFYVADLLLPLFDLSYFMQFGVIRGVHWNRSASAPFCVSRGGISGHLIIELFNDSYAGV